METLLMLITTVYVTTERKGGIAGRTAPAKLGISRIQIMMAYVIIRRESESVNRMVHAKPILQMQITMVYATTERKGRIAGRIGSCQAGNFTDADNDGICDNCGHKQGGSQARLRQESSNFIDDDNDGVCDNKENNCGNRSRQNCGSRGQNKRG